MSKDAAPGVPNFIQCISFIRSELKEAEGVNNIAKTYFRVTMGHIVTLRILHKQL